ncbi:DUF881 domain-containing protein [Blastococcus sp. Marseille-P5729]|uniref:DUF881 domain-containing protein n=1 Tax=Blastococcus sp. Marseille-P5729 TaxID=2086582 RepID=UPI000D114065|nr:DUF881 domain-containing protein [Blastococcus sp. Marseille-P5729]
MARRSLRERLLQRRLPRPSAWSVAVPVIALVSGLLFAISSSTADGTDLRSDRVRIEQVIRDRVRSIDGLEQQRKTLQTEIDVLTQTLTEHDGGLAALAEQTSDAERAAGFSPVRGPAVRVTLTDAPLGPDGELPAGARPDDVVIHQSDVQGVVNAMWVAGADAVMIQGQRIITTSSVLCVGNTLLLGGKVYSPPFVIVAIGDHDAIQQALQDSPGVQLFLDAVEAFGLGYEVEALQEVTIPAYDGTIGISHATAVRE